jgi:hypothetical protein
MVFANWALVILTIVLVVVTIYYAVYTRKMAKIMAREFELRVAPFLVVEQVTTSPGTSSKSYIPLIYNKGSLPVYVKKVVLEWYYKELPNKIFRAETKIDKVLGGSESVPYGQSKITLAKESMVTQDFQKNMDFDFRQLLGLSQGKIYCTYIDIINGTEQKTADLYTLEHL